MPGISGAGAGDEQEDLSDLSDSESAEEYTDNDLDEDRRGCGPRHEFDVTSSGNHPYLFTADEVTECTDLKLLPELSTHKLPVMPTQNVVFPGQTMPVNSRCPFTISIMNAAMKGDKFVAIVSCCEPHKQPSDCPQIGVIAKVTKYSEINYRVQAELLVVQRCQIVEMKSNYFGNTFSGEAEVTVAALPEYVLRPFPTTIIPSTLRGKSIEKKLRIIDAITSVPRMVATYGTKEKCEDLIKHFQLWFKEDNLRNILALGETAFSFWACANIHVDIPTKNKLLKVNQTDIRIEILLEITKFIGGIVCMKCKHELCERQNLIKMNPEGTGGLFVNPAGNVHDLLTVTRVKSFLPEGPPSSEFSWFPGYKWQVIRCGSCRTFIGWVYKSDVYEPARFYGLTRSSVQPAYEGIESLEALFDP